MGEIQSMHLCVAHGDPPMGIPWNANGTFHWWNPWHGFMGSSWGSTNGHSMECHWGHLMEMCSKEWFYGELMGNHQGCSMSSSWGIPHHCHSMAWCWDFSWGGIPWDGSMGSSWGSTNGHPIGMPLGFLMGKSMACIYG